MINKILIIIIILNLLLIGYNINYKTVIVLGDSMNPTLHEKDKVKCKKRPKKIKRGDIISYRVDGISIIHRVHDKKITQGIEYFIMKGDNNDMVDPLPITKENIYCKVIEK